MLFLKLEEFLDCLKPFLIALNYLPEHVVGIKDKWFIMNTENIMMDFAATEKVKAIFRESTRTHTS